MRAPWGARPVPADSCESAAPASSLGARGRRLGPAALGVPGILVFLAFTGLCCRSSPTTVPLGAYMPLTGPLASFGISARNGIELAIQQINSRGGVGGKLLEVTYLDDQGDPEIAGESARRLIENDGVSAILGGVLSSTSLAAAPICQESGVPMISPSATNPQVTLVGDFILRVCYVDSFQGTAMATFAYTSLGVSRVALVSKKGNDYSEGLANYFARTFEELGGEVVARTFLPEDAGSLGGRLSSLMAKRPDALFLPLYYQDAAAVARALAERRLEVLLLGGDGWDSPDLVRLAGDGVEGAYFTTHFSPDDRRATVRAFVKAYRERYNETPDAIAALGYDAAGLVASALALVARETPRAFSALSWAGAGPGGSEELASARRELRDKLATTRSFEGVTGEVTIGPLRNALKPATVLQVRDGAFHYAGVVRP